MRGGGSFSVKTWVSLSSTTDFPGRTWTSYLSLLSSDFIFYEWEGERLSCKANSTGVEDRLGMAGDGAEGSASLAEGCPVWSRRLLGLGWSSGRSEVTLSWVAK